MPIKQFSLAVLICGALDIGYAALMTMLKGASVAAMLRGLASGPFGDAALGWGAGGVVLGLAVHFAIMAVMVAVWFALAANTRLGSISPWIAGAGYGIVLYLVMYCVVLTLRWPEVYPLTGPTKIFMSLFPHIALVGIPLAFIAPRAPATLVAAG